MCWSHKHNKLKQVDQEIESREQSFGKSVTPLFRKKGWIAGAEIERVLLRSRFIWAIEWWQIDVLEVSGRTFRRCEEKTTAGPRRWDILFSSLITASQLCFSFSKLYPQKLKVSVQEWDPPNPATSFITKFGLVYMWFKKAQSNTNTEAQNTASHSRKET